MLMTRAALQDICKEHKLYRTASLNEKLYCNFKGFTNIANLEEYTGLKALFLEGNAIDSLQGFPELKELRCLYVQQNNIYAVSGLDRLQALDTLNISHNAISKLENLSCCPNLRTLICTHNKLSDVESIAHLAEVKGLHTLDLQNNDLQDPAILDIIKQLPELKCLYLKGNPVVSKMKNYRKTIIAAIPTLAYLDERPVFEDERRIVDAWARGGLDAEREERKLVKAEEEERNRRNFEAMQEMRKEGWRKRREKEGLVAGDTDPALDEFSDDEYVFQEEPPELVEARRRLATYSAQAGVEEPPELSEARNTFVRGGGHVQEGQYSGSAADDVAYLESVKAQQAELDRAALHGSHGVSHHADDALDQIASSGVAHASPDKESAPVALEAEVTDDVREVDLSELD